MKFIYFAVCIFALQAVNCQDETFTETLLRAQSELNLAHWFVETHWINHRQMIGDVLEALTKFSIDKFMDSVEIIKGVASETREVMTQYQSSACSDDARNRWERQVLSHGYRLNFCIKEATRILTGEWYELYYYDMDATRLTSHTPNQGLNMMSQNDVMDTSIDFYRIINNRLRDLLLRASPWIVIMDELLELMNHHTELAEFGVTMCTMGTTLQFNDIAARALEDIARCDST